jgi:hypothetical protein
MLSDMLCWLRPVSTRCTFRRFLGGEGIQLEGLSSGLGSPWSRRRGFVPLCHAPYATLSEEWLTSLRLLGDAREPPEPWTLRALVSSPGLGWHWRPGAKDRVQTPVDRELTWGIVLYLHLTCGTRQVACHLYHVCRWGLISQKKVWYLGVEPGFWTKGWNIFTIELDAWLCW